MSPVLEIVVLLLVSDVEDRLHPPIVPPVAVMLLVETVPVMLAFVAVTAPALVTEKAALVPEVLVAPAKNAKPGSVAVSIIPAYFVAPRFVIRSEAIDQPPIAPLLAVIDPVMSALAAVNAPVFVTLKFVLVIA